MRKYLLLFLLLPALMNAQINRSATEFAKEQVGEYINTKIFKGENYKSVSFGKLTSLKEKETGIFWFIKHEFEITPVHSSFGKNEVVQQPYKFAFYLDEKMKVVKAEANYLK